MHVLLRVVILLVGLAATGVTAGSMQASAQVFPYSAPAAPEFDDYGNVVQGGSDIQQDRRSREPEVSQPPKRSSSRRGPARAEDPEDYRTVRPFTPQPASPQPPPGPPPQTYSPPAGPTPAPGRVPPPQMAATPPRQMVRPDCSGFPMMIARSRSEGEMQAIAKQYLTCLLQNGWNMEQARIQVINTIESTFQLAR